MRRSLCPHCFPALQCSLALQKHTNLCTLKDHTYCTPSVALQRGTDRRNMHYQNHAEHFPSLLDRAGHVRQARRAPCTQTQQAGSPGG